MSERLTPWHIRARLFALGCVMGGFLGANARRDPVNADAGVHTRWLVSQLPGPSDIRPAVAGGLVLFGTKGGTVVARDTATGSPVWTARVAYPNDPVGGEDMVVQGTLAIVPVRFHVTAIDAATGVERWRYTTPLDTVEAGPNPDPGYLVRTHMAADDRTVFIPAWGRA